MYDIFRSLLVLAAIVAVALETLTLAWGLVELHETDQLFLTSRATTAQRQQLDLIHRAHRLERWIARLWVSVVGLMLLSGSLLVYV